VTSGEEETPTPTWRVVDVNDLPWAHLPFKCRWKRDVAASHCDSFGDFIRSLTPAQIAECEYHVGTDWVIAAHVACELVEAGTTTPDDFSSAAAGHDACTGWGIVSFRSHPIFLNGDELGNGQHRVCAMKLADVARCPIEN
jgi:hypothetical protein